MLILLHFYSSWCDLMPTISYGELRAQLSGKSWLLFRGLCVSLFHPIDIRVYFIFRSMYKILMWPPHRSLYLQENGNSQVTKNNYIFYFSNLDLSHRCDMFALIFYTHADDNCVAHRMLTQWPPLTFELGPPRARTVQNKNKLDVLLPFLNSSCSRRAQLLSN